MNTTSIVLMFSDETSTELSLKIGFDWAACFSPIIFGIPHLRRGMKSFGWSFLALELMSFVDSIDQVVINGNDSGTPRLIFLQLIMLVSLCHYLGRNGMADYAKHLLTTGYRFSEPDSDSTRMAKAAWGIVPNDDKPYRSTTDHTPALSTAREEAEWHFLSGTTPAGPHSLTQLKAFAREGTITPDTRIAKAGATQWSMARDIPEFAALFR